MASRRPETRGLPWWWPALPGLGVAFLGVGALGDAPLGDAGLAHVVIAACAAVFIGAPLARHSWSTRVHLPRRAFQRGLVDVAVVGSWAELTAGRLPVPLVLVTLALATLLHAPRAAGLLGTLAPAFVVSFGGLALFHPPDWSWLEPDLRHASSWLGGSVTAGVLFGWVPAYWRHAPPPVPGRTRLPFVVAGIGVLGTIGSALGAGALHASTLGAAARPAGPILALVALAPWLGTLPTRPRRASLAAVLGLSFLLWHRAIPPGLWWPLLCPVLLGVAALLQGGTTGWLGGLLLLGATAFGDIPYPESIEGGFFAMVPWIVAFWIGATRATAERGAS